MIVDMLARDAEAGGELARSDFGNEFFLGRRLLIGVIAGEAIATETARDASCVLHFVQESGCVVLGALEPGCIGHDDAVAMLVIGRKLVAMLDGERYRPVK